MTLDMEEPMDTAAQQVNAVLPPADEAGFDPTVAPPAMLSPVASFNAGTTAPPSPMAAPAGPVPTEIAFSFDTTGSMSSCLEEVQNHLKTIINRLFMDIPALKIGIIAHGDYCDQEHFYVTKSVDFTNDVNALFDFVTNCGGTGGGDYEECYELVLKKVREELSWSPGTTKSLVMIGDAIPHPPGHGGNDGNLDWRDELDRLHGELGVRVYAVQCMSDYNTEATVFWKELSKRSFGKHLEMNEFATVIDLIMAICYKEGGNPALFEAYEREVRAREGPMIGRELDRMFLTLRDGANGASTSAAPSRIAKGVAGKKRSAPKTTKAVQAVAKAKAPKQPRRRTVPDLQERVKKLRVAKFKVANIRPAQKREKVSNANFALNHLRWGSWMHYRSDNGYRNTKLFRQNRDKPAVYEVSVQTGNRARRNVVFYAATAGIRTGVNWDSYIFRQAYVRQQLNHVLGQGVGCRVHVRRALLPKTVKFGGRTMRSAREVSTFLRNTYDYAWMGKYNGPAGVIHYGRDLTKGRVVLSARCGFS